MVWSRRVYPPVSSTVGLVGDGKGQMTASSHQRGCSQDLASHMNQAQGGVDVELSSCLHA